MGLLSSLQAKPWIGVDLGASSVKMAQLRSSPEGIQLLAACAVELPPQHASNREARLAAQGQQIKALLKTSPFQGRQAVISLPAEAVFLQPVRLPNVPANQLDAFLKEELTGKLPYSLDEAVFRHMAAGTVYGDSGEMQEMLIVSVCRKELDGYLEMATKAGLDVMGINIEACAVVECFARFFRRSPDDTRMTLFIDIGCSSTKVVLAQGRRMVFARNLHIGGLSMDTEVARALKIPLEQAHGVRRKMVGSQTHAAAEDDLFRLLDVKIAEITDEITHCLLYCESSFKSQAVERVIFVGGQAHNKRLCQSIAERLNLPAQVGDPLAGIQRLPQAAPALAEARGPQPSWAVAVGLSLGASLVA